MQRSDIYGNWNEEERENYRGGVSKGKGKLQGYSETENSRASKKIDGIEHQLELTFEHRNRRIEVNRLAKTVLDIF